MQVATALGAVLRNEKAKSQPCGVFGSFGWSGEAVDEMEGRLKVSFAPLVYVTINDQCDPSFSLRSVHLGSPGVISKPQEWSNLGSGYMGVPRSCLQEQLACRYVGAQVAMLRVYPVALTLVADCCRMLASGLHSTRCGSNSSPAPKTCR